MSRLLPLKALIDSSRPLTYGIVQAGEDVVGGVPYIRPVDMDGHNGVRVQGLRRTDPSIAHAYRRSALEAGDIVVSIGPSFGKTMVVTSELAGANLTQGTARVAPARGVDREYLRWALQSHDSLSFWDSMSGGSTFRALNLAPLGRTPIPVHTLARQQAIADYLDRETAQIDAFIAKNEELITLLTERLASATGRAVTVGINEGRATSPSSVDWLDQTPVPAHWEVWKLGRLAKLQSGDFIAAEEIEEDGPYPVYGGGGLRGFTSGYNVVGEHAVIGRQGALCGQVRLLDGEFYATEHAVVVYPRRPVDGTWLQAILQSMNLGQYSVSAAQPGLSVEVISSKRIPVPPLSEQRSIGEHLRDVVARTEAAIAVARNAVYLARERRAALISAAVTGKIDVGVAV